jgi:proton-dependent oligopeptide transporter, POT family
MNPTTPIQHEQLFGHPKGLFVCFLTEMWERFAFYGMKTLLFLYLTKHHRFDDGSGYLLLGTYAGIAYALPLIGGMLADRYIGMRRAVIIGGVLLAIGQLGMAYVGTPALNVGGQISRDGFAVQVMYFSLALIALGVGYLKPSISTIVGRLYSENDPRRESGFSIFYMGINIGATAATLVCAKIGGSYGYGYGFGLAGVLMTFGLANFVFGQRHFNGVADVSDPGLLQEKIAGLSRSVWIFLGTLIASVVIWKMLQTSVKFDALSNLLGGHDVTATEIVAVLMGLGLLIWMVWFTASQCGRVEAQRMWVLFTLTGVSAIFWGLYEQTYGVWVAIAERATNLSELDTPLYTWLPAEAGNTNFFAGFFVVLMSPLFAMLWPKLDRLNLNPSTPMKFAIALLLCGLAFGVLAYGCAHPAENGKMSAWWIVLAYAVLVMGEMALSPIGLSMVTSLSVARVVGLMMGAWFLFSAFGEMIAGRLSTFAAIPAERQATITSAEALQFYGSFLTQMMWIGIGSAVVLALFTPILKRGMHSQSEVS